MSSSSVQFYGIEPVLEAYGNASCPRFSLWTGKLLLLKYDGWKDDEFVKPSMEEGLQTLNNYLNAMYQGSTAIYTLKLYEDMTDKQKITPSTEYSTAFNFKVNESLGQQGMGVVRQPYGVMAELQKTNQRIDALIEAMNNDDEEEDEPEEKKSFVNTITGGLIADNQEVKELIDLCKSLFAPQQPIQSTPATVGNVQRVSEISSDVETGSDRLNRINKAVQVLEQLDPNFVDNLEILAKVAQRDPQQFKQFLMILKSLE